MGHALRRIAVLTTADCIVTTDAKLRQLRVTLSERREATSEHDRPRIGTGTTMPGRLWIMLLGAQLRQAQIRQKYLAVGTGDLLSGFLTALLQAFVLPLPGLQPLHLD